MSDEGASGDATGPGRDAAEEPSRDDGRDAAAAEPSRDEMLDNTPEAVAMRRARAARAEAAARTPAPAPRRRSRRGVVLGLLSAVAAAGALARMTGRGP